MKALFLTSSILALLLFTACSEDKKPEEEKVSAMKCEAGKCSTAMDESKKVAK